MPVTRIIKRISFFAATALLLGVVPLLALHANAAPYVQNRTLTLSSSLTLAPSVNYLISFTYPAPTTVGSIVFEFCEETPIPNTPCTSPVGFSANSVNLVTQTGDVGFGLSGASTINRVILTRAPAMTSGQPASYNLGNITNPENVGTYYARIYTYPTNNATGPATYEGGIAFAMNRYVPIEAIVPPYLTFCVGKTIPQYNCTSANGDFIDFGEFSTTQTKSAQHQMLVATNAPYGYNITLSGQTLTSGNHIINSLVSPTASATNQSQFGLNLRANSIGGSDPVGPGTGGSVTGNYNIPNRYTFNNGDVIASSNTVSDFWRLTASYIANINRQQAPGVYNTTILYICLANF